MGVWIDTDMGFDDIAAIFVVDHAGPAIDGVSLVFGVAALEQVERNAAGAAQAFGWRFPIHSGRARPVLARLETAERILGPTGILGATLPDASPFERSDAFAALCAWLAAATARIASSPSGRSPISPPWRWRGRTSPRASAT